MQFKILKSFWLQVQLAEIIIDSCIDGCLRIVDDTVYQLWLLP